MVLQTTDSSKPNGRASSLGVVIPACRASKTLRSCVAAVLNSTCGAALDIVVVDDGGNGDVQKLLAGLSARVLCGAPTGSAALARNKGAANVKGGILVFVDADVEVECAAIERLVTPILLKQAEAVIGNYTDAVEGLDFVQSYKQLYIHTVYSRQRGYIENQFWTALGAIRRDTFAELGGFGADFPNALGEDVELGQRLTDTGRRIMCQPEARGRHLKDFTVYSLIRNDLRKGLGFVKLELGQGRPVTDCRHCQPRDVAAVVLAGSLSGFALSMPALIATGVSLAWFEAFTVFITILLGGYVATRFDLLAAFSGRGVGFVSRAAPLMIILDLVRGLAIAIGIWRLGVQRILFRHHGPKAKLKPFLQGAGQRTQGAAKTALQQTGD